LIMSLLNKITDANFERVACSIAGLASDGQLSVVDILTAVFGKNNDDTSYTALFVRLVKVVSAQDTAASAAFLEKHITDYLCDGDALWTSIDAVSSDIGPNEYDRFCAVIKSRTALLNTHRAMVLISAGLDAPSVTARLVDATFRSLDRAYETVVATGSAQAMISTELALDCIVNLLPVLAGVKMSRNDVSNTITRKLLAGAKSESALTPKCRFKALRVVDLLRCDRCVVKT